MHFWTHALRRYMHCPGTGTSPVHLASPVHELRGRLRAALLFVDLVPWIVGCCLFERAALVEFVDIVGDAARFAA